MSDSASAGDGKGKGKVVSSSPSFDSETEQEKRPHRRRSPHSMASLEAALPMKRGVSRNYDGKSKSFGNLTALQFEDAKDMVKKEHPVNKRRRLILAHEILFEKIKSTDTQSYSVPFSPSDDHNN